MADKIYHSCNENLNIANRFEQTYQKSKITKEMPSNTRNEAMINRSLHTEDDDEDMKTIMLKLNESAREKESIAGRPYECEFCLRRFTSKSLLQQHRERHRTKRLQYECKKCGLVFLVSSHLKNHKCAF